ncbi:MAG: T9SS type A sorting domain-containing protein [Chitinophagaceae bacterium]|nr:T9SS type A sorting domain-containing protein [Chitinophagaceae bacterium]
MKTISTPDTIRKNTSEKKMQKPVFFALTLLLLTVFQLHFVYATNGTGVVTVTSGSGSCVDYTPAQGGGPDNWEVSEGGSYTMTITGVTECGGSTITVFVQSSSSGNFCFNATGGGGTYTGNFSLPATTCNTMPISYKCGADGDCSNEGTFNAAGPSGSKSVHLRSSYFDSNCDKTETDEDCNAGCTLSLSGTDTDVSCYGENNGAIDVTVSDAQGTVTYQWSDGATSEDRTDLVPGVYTVTAEDDECSKTSTFTISEPVALGLSGSALDVTVVGGSDGSIDITVSGGTGSYSYSWNDGSTDEDRNNLAAGTYTVTVTDENGCTIQESFIVNDVECTITVDAGADDSKCHNDPTSLYAVSSDPNATFSWSPASGVDNPNIANPVTNVTQTTTFTVTVTGSNGCVASDEVTITAYKLVKAKIEIYPNTPSCEAPCLKLFTKNNPNYSYEWRLNGQPIVGAADKNTYCACVSGDYSVHVTDLVSGCMHTSKKFVVVIAPKMEDGNKDVPTKEMSLNVWPNPATDNLNITVSNGSDGSVKVQLLDVFGREIMLNELNGSRYEQTITWNMNDLSNGVYFVRVLNGDNRIEQKVMVIK